MITRKHAPDRIEYLTPEGVTKLEERLKYLKEVRRAEIAAQLRQAFEEGTSLDEDAETEQTRKEQEFVEGEIQRLEHILRTAKVVVRRKNATTIGPGSTVTVVEKGSRSKEVYTLVGSAESDPHEGKISVDCPLGRALLRAKVGDEVIVDAPDGKLHFIVKAIK
jgi:transcription elongation factor GreA